MADLNEVSNFDAGVYQIETTDPVLGGPSGVTNLPAKNLANRTRWLKDQIDALAAAVDLTATEAWVLEQLQALDHKQSVRAATVANISLAGIQTIDGVSLVVGNRVLVKNQSSAAENGIYVVASLNWTRATDANTGEKLNSGAVVAVEEGTLQANSRWQLTTDGPVSIGTTPLVFGDVTAGFAPLASPQFTGSPLAPTAPQFDNDTSLATTAFVQRALGSHSGVEIVAANRTMTVADAGKYLFSNANSLVYTLPNPATLALGTKFRIAQGNLTSGGTINAPSGATIGNITAGGTVTSVAMQQSTEYVLTVVSTTAYQLTVISPSDIDTGWLTPSFTNSFTDAGSCRYRRKNGVVTVSLIVNRPTPPSNDMGIFTLPAGFRPSIDLAFTANASRDSVLAFGNAAGLVTAGGVLRHRYTVGFDTSGSGYALSALISFPV